jgi:hypothetical protein
VADFPLLFQHRVMVLRYSMFGTEHRAVWCVDCDRPFAECDPLLDVFWQKYFINSPQMVFGPLFSTLSTTPTRNAHSP